MGGTFASPNDPSSSGPQSAPRPTLGDELADAFKAVDVLEDRLAFATDPDELGDALCEIVALRNRVNAAEARLADAAARNGVPQANGQRTCAQYVASRTNTSAIAINRGSRRMKWLRDFPILEAAFGTTMTDEHVDYLRKLDTSFATHQRLTIDQELMVDIARTCSFKDFTIACDYWLIRIDPDGAEPKDQVLKTHLRVRTGVGGRGEISGECDALTRQMLTVAIDHEADKIRTADKDAGITRSDGQRRMAALANLVARGFARNDGTYPAPLINIVMSLKVAEWATKTLSGDTEPLDNVPVDPFDVDGRCELIDGTPIHPFLALFAFNNIGTNLIGAPNLRRYVMDANSRALDVSVNTRYFPEWMRTAALVESRGQCLTHGCDDTPHSWLQIDHIEPFAHGGETEHDNAQTQCGPDNQAKAATTGTVPWCDRPPPPRHRRYTSHKTPAPNDADEDDADSPRDADDEN